ncbi:MAG: VWA domain-containing protein [Chloroflexi bacterium]|nr:VWA domain-containing protein [Chloroflexota bacterium]MDA1147285.1 VWA domain-containing protein [Chloroflexota bacterium]
MAMRYRYSEWDGTQEIPGLDADQILDALSDDLMNFGDLQHALRNLMQRGMRTPQQGRMQGLRDLLQQLRQQRRERLDRFDMGGVMDDIRKQLEEILDLERDTLRERLGEPDDGDGQQPGDQSGSEQQPGDQQPGGEQQPGGQQQPGQQPSGQPQMGGQRQPGQQGQQGERGEAGQAGGESGPSDEEQFQQMLERIAQRKQDFLDQLPGDPAGQMKELQNYEFLNPDAQHRYQELVEQLRQAMTESFFNDVSKMVDEMSEGDMERMKDMVRDLNDMLAQRMRGEEPDFDQFMEQYGDMFGENPPQSLDDLIAQMQSQMQAMQSLMESMPSDQRQQLQGLLADKLGDAELESELSELAQNLDFLNPSRDQPSSYPFRGEEEIGLEAAMHLMNEMQNIDNLESGLERAQYTGELDGVDIDQLRELLGDEAVDTFEELKQLLEVLENAGYIRKEGDEWQLTPRGTRMIGQNALTEIFRQLKNQGIGNHPVPQSGRHGERLDETKPYEFGDPFHLDMRRTIMNAIEREGPSTPVKLSADDFEIYRSELVTQTATVLMVDLSWSMALRGSFQAAKKVALALQNLIKAQYPRDSLYIIGFSAYARELKPQDLPYVRWDESVLGTNMHHALMIAERLLAKHRGGTRQILMISDGEPTAHLENGRSQFAYPPSPITIRETLKAVKRVTQQEITINTFMLDRNYYLKEFVNQLAKINGGRVFYTTPDQLGEYILVDYVQHKRKKISGR